ncbi:hypothetical protein [Undibacterium sp. TS12]|uniref:hypothetical protein n=1 Tax=Undibacterium sp. TS12 TaxID=2908202 RepID=UPI001F4C8A14|nr:hypothetical protein [Undibacterium sp. TS12]MCH8618860.1 hypothetical protein [Undibacterium sp. TS12]
MSLTIVPRFLTIDDISTLLELESRQWTSNQAASADKLRKRLLDYPKLCLGAFCSHTGKALASLFMRPISPEEVAHARRWEDCVEAAHDSTERKTSSLFGISLTSVEPRAVAALFSFFWPHALKNGWRQIYLGSPIPGFKRALENNPSLDANTYAHSQARGGKLPFDPQLRYYYGKGFTRIVAVLPDYFPHDASLDHGVLIQGTVPLSQLWLVWQRLPFKILKVILHCVEYVEDTYAEYMKPRPGLKDTPTGEKVS